MATVSVIIHRPQTVRRYTQANTTPTKLIPTRRLPTNSRETGGAFWRIPA